MSGTDAKVVSGYDIHIPFQNDLCCGDLGKSLFQISEGQTGIGFGAFALKNPAASYEESARCCGSTKWIGFL